MTPISTTHVPECNWSHDTFPPVRSADLVRQAWAHLMLDSRGYAAHCFELCAHFIHYEACPPPDVCARYARTLELYTTFFGSAPHAVWQSVDDFNKVRRKVVFFILEKHDPY